MLKIHSGWKCALILLGILSAGFTALGCASSQTEPEKFEKMDPKQIYSTNGQKGLKTALDSGSKIEEDLRVKSRSGASNIYFVRGKDFDQAIQATHRVIFFGQPGDRIFLDDPQEGQIWMVVYWGVGGSHPPVWTIKSVERSEKTIRVHYHEQGAETDDARNYYAWIPLGNPKVGTYQLEMWNQSTKEKTLARVCWITEKR